MTAMIFMDYWWLVIPGVLLGLYAQAKLSSTYSLYVRVGTASGVTGAQAAREILDQAGLHNVEVAEVGGHLTDHYDPRKRALFLSSENFRGRSIAAVGVAAHEAGHALQHRLRTRHCRSAWPSCLSRNLPAPPTWAFFYSG